MNTNTEEDFQICISVLLTQLQNLFVHEKLFSELSQTSQLELLTEIVND